MSRYPFIVPGSTPVHRFRVPLAANSIEKANVAYFQKGNVLLTKETQEITIPEEHEPGEDVAEFSIRLSQEETLLFANSTMAEVQVNLLMTDGYRHPSVIAEIGCGKQLYKEVMSDADAGYP